MIISPVFLFFCFSEVPLFLNLDYHGFADCFFQDFLVFWGFQACFCFVFFGKKKGGY
jgi:hypothetical protein